MYRFYAIRYTISSVKRNLPNIGVDVVEVARFARLLKTSKDNFLNKVFTNEEVSYAQGCAEPAVHLAGFFAAKEASSKAFGVKEYPFIEFEIRHAKDGAPEVWHKGRKKKASVSITHSRKVAVAVVLV